MPATAYKPKYQFRLLTGIHQQAKLDDEGNQVYQIIRDAAGNERQVPVSETFVAKKSQSSFSGEHSGDVVWSDKDLTSLNHPEQGARHKFQKIGGSSFEEEQPSIDDVPNMNVEQLKAFANTNGINLEGITKKADMIEVIEAEMLE